MNLETPVDTPLPPKKHPKRGIRKRVLGEGDGDYCVYEIASPNSNLPRGALIPIPNIPRFVDTVTALRWIRKDSGDILAGKQVMIFQAKEILNLQAVDRVSIVIQAKPKVVINRTPETSD
jgi:hypothetical protein